MGAAVDILIPFGLGSAWQNNELRYCLRSIERFATGYERIFVVGDDPGFLSSVTVPVASLGASETHALHFYPLKDIACNKQGRIAHKIFWAFQHTDISNTAVLFNDDYVLRAPVDLSKLLPYQRGPLRLAAERQQDPEYRACLAGTAEALEEAGKFSLHYDIHLPMQLLRHPFVDLKLWWQRSLNDKHGFVVKSTYANNVLLWPGPTMRDCKFRHTYTVQEIEAFTQGRFCFSYCDEGLTPTLKQWLTEKFPEKSRFEVERASTLARSDRNRDGYATL